MDVVGFGLQVRAFRIRNAGARSTLPRHRASREASSRVSSRAAPTGSPWPPSTAWRRRSQRGSSVACSGEGRRSTGSWMPTTRRWSIRWFGSCRANGWNAWRRHRSASVASADPSTCSAYHPIDPRPPDRGGQIDARGRSGHPVDARPEGSASTRVGARAWLGATRGGEAPCLRRGPYDPTPGGRSSGDLRGGVPIVPAPAGRGSPRRTRSDRSQVCGSCQATLTRSHVIELPRSGRLRLTPRRTRDQNRSSSDLQALE